jgi:transposase InsO family protein
MQMQGGSLSVRELCQTAAVSRASYYRRWRKQEPREEQIAVRDAIQRLALENRHYGYRRITRLLKRDGWEINHKRVLRLMRADNLLCIRRRRFVITTDSDHSWRVYPNLAPRMQVRGINQLWVADITYVRLKQEFIYLAVILDVYSRRVVGWNISRQLGGSISQQALEMAIDQRQPAPGLIHHSDRGVQYACGQYVEKLQEAGIVISMSRPGNPWDNAWAESFMRTLKREEVDGRRYRNFADAESSIATFIEEVYNQHRLHSALDYLSPMEFEADLQQTPQMTYAGGHHKAQSQPIKDRSERFFESFHKERKKKQKRKKLAEGDGLLKLPQLRKSKADAFGAFS